ncbi:unnamed protein product [Effrenium voratum]|nr:unnamed protein product [Effrenium voratum]
MFTAISVSGDDLRAVARVWSGCQTLARLHQVKDAEVLRADGEVLDLGKTLQAQGLRDGSRLILQERQRKQQPRAHETVLEMDMGTDVEVPAAPRAAHLFDRAEREAKATELKQKANEVLKEGGYAEACAIYSAALAYLPPEESDVQLAGAILGNRALASLKLSRWADARADAEKSLQLVPENPKVQFRLGLALQALGELLAAAEALEKVAHEDCAARALAQVRARLAPAPKAAEASPPRGLKWRLAWWQQGFRLPRLREVWRDFTDLTSPLSNDHALALMHTWRYQGPLHDFFLQETSKAARSFGLPAIVVLGTGNMAAARACLEVLHSNDACQATLLEPSEGLAYLAREVLQPEKRKMRVLHSSGQLDTEFAYPSSVLRKPGLVLVCDRLAEDLVGEGLVKTLAAAKAAAEKAGNAQVVCVPARAELLMAPLELRSSEFMGVDVSKANALRFTAHSEDVPQEERLWKCEVCSWCNALHVKGCELCRAARRPKAASHQQSKRTESSGWWPMDLDAEAAHAGMDGSICRLCAEAQVICAFDFNNAAVFQEQQRMLEKTVTAIASCQCHVNAIAVWWRLHGFDDSTIDTSPGSAGTGSLPWPTKRQAVFHLGYEIGIEQGESMELKVHFSDAFCRIRFDLQKPRLVDRMGLIKFEVDITSRKVLDELRSKVDVKTNRLLGSVDNTPLRRRDKALSFGPFELVPGMLNQEIWRKVAERLERHSERPRRGDQPLRCVFRHGVFEGSRRWPLPTLAETSAVPRRSGYFRFAAWAAYVEDMESALADVSDAEGAGLSGGRPRVLELNCGPAPLLSLRACRAGARVWALEPIPDLRELALETVRDQGMEMVFERKGLASSFFGGAKMPGEPSVRVLKPMLSTALQAGSDAKFLDGGRADLVVCRPEPGPLGLDYLETMLHASQELLAPGGRLVPRALLVHVVAVEYPWHGVCLQRLVRRQVEVPFDQLRTLSSQAIWQVDLTSPGEPSMTGDLEAD